MGIRLVNPFLVASAPPAASGERIAAAASHGWAGCVTKTITSSPAYSHNLSPAMRRPRERNWRALGLLNNELVTAGSLDLWCTREIPSARLSAGEDFCLGVSIAEGRLPSDWKDAAARVSSAGASYVELNVSCPHGAPERLRGSHIGDDVPLLGEVVAAACAGASVPVAVKLNALSPSLHAAAVTAVRNGARGIVTTNTFMALPSLDGGTLGPPSGRDQGLTPMGLSGPALLPLNRHAVATLVPMLDCDVTAVGGVVTASDAMDYLMLGASAVQVATAVILQGLDVVDRLISGLRERLERSSSSQLVNIIGAALTHVTTAAAAHETAVPLVAVVDQARCTLCDACVRPCSVGGADCITIGQQRLYVDDGRCTGCGLCVAVCPVDALSLRASPAVALAHDETEGGST